MQIKPNLYVLKFVTSGKEKIYRYTNQDMNMVDLLFNSDTTSRVLQAAEGKKPVGQRGKNLKFMLLIAFFVLIMPAQAQAYIGPGAGFAVAGSFLAIFGAVFAGMLAIFTWPIRYLIRAIRGRHAFRPQPGQKIRDIRTRRPGLQPNEEVHGGRKAAELLQAS